LFSFTRKFLLFRFVSLTGQGHTTPPAEAVEIRLASAASGVRRGFGSVPVEAAINGVAWRTSIFPQKSGGYILPIKADVRKRAGVAAGDEVTLSLSLL
jgi:hypothetical protein